MRLEDGSHAEGTYTGTLQSSKRRGAPLKPCIPSRNLNKGTRDPKPLRTYLSLRGSSGDLRPSPSSRLKLRISPGARDP